MKSKTIRLFVMISLSSFLLFVGSQAYSFADGLIDSPPEGFRPIFNGKDLSGWRGVPQLDPRKWAGSTVADKEKWRNELAAHWSVQGDEIVNDGFGPFLTTDREYGDFELLIQYKTVPKADSGIYLRGCPQIQIWDSTDEAQIKLGANKGSGGLWNNSAGAAGKDPTVLADKPFGQWNQLRIRLIGQRCSVWLNDKQVVDNAIMENYWDRALPLFAKGALQLQTHGGEIRWKSIYLREINTEEANKLLRQMAGTGFTDLYNGKDLTGWAGATDNYSVVDGAIQCKKDKGGVLYANQPYSDFTAQLEFQLPPAGNNGLAIRYPGQGDTAYDGMCELQVLDTDDSKYQSIDKRQTHGSAYGMAAAHRGYLRPVGEWNYQVVTVRGSTITVELNGTRILNADLSKVTEFLDNKPHPGKDRKEGFFGFAGHNDPVRFRAISIRPIPPGL